MQLLDSFVHHLTQVQVGIDIETRFCLPGQGLGGLWAVLAGLQEESGETLNDVSGAGEPDVDGNLVMLRAWSGNHAGCDAPH